MSFIGSSSGFDSVPNPGPLSPFESLGLFESGLSETPVEGFSGDGMTVEETSAAGERPKLTTAIASTARRETRKALVILSALLASLALAFAALGWQIPMRLRGLRPLPPISQEDLQACQEKLTASATLLTNAWSESSEAVRKAFCGYYTPIPADGIPLAEPLKVYEKHVQALLNMHCPVESDPEEDKRAYASQMKLMTSVCTAAAERLKGLQRFEAKQEETGIMLPIFHKKAAVVLPAEENLEADGDLVTFEEFLKMHSNLAVFRSLSGSKVKGKVPRVLTERLRDLILWDEDIRQDNEKVAKAYEVFLQSLGLSPRRLNRKTIELMNPIRIPHEKGNFQTKLFLSYLFQKLHPYESKSLLPGLAEGVAAKWNLKGVKEKMLEYMYDQKFGLKLQVQEKRELVEQGESVAPGAQMPIHALAVFLL